MITELPENGVFCFGSNRRGTHGKGAALYAKKHFGAVNGVGEGRTGRCYAIPTKDTPWTTLPLDAIRRHVNVFLTYARMNPELQFFVTRIGCGEAGYRDDQIAPMFRHAPANCALPEEWTPYVAEERS